jgi:hypothetical protein
MTDKLCDFMWEAGDYFLRWPAPPSYCVVPFFINGGLEGCARLSRTCPHCNNIWLDPYFKGTGEPYTYLFRDPDSMLPEDYYDNGFNQVKILQPNESIPMIQRKEDWKIPLTFEEVGFVRTSPLSVKNRISKDILDGITEEL